MKKNLSTTSINSFGVARAYFSVFTHPCSLPAILYFIGTVAWKFFLFQYMQKIHLRHVPIKNADHQLDASIPFREDLGPVYLDFINFWIRPISMSVKKFGWWKGTIIGTRFIKKIASAYNQAYRVYSRNITTTIRPKAKTRMVRNIQRADPHYCCVPSLHIAVVLLVIFFWKKTFEDENFSDTEKSRWTRELYEHGIRIAESVLYMKQHSVNCIPAAMFMMTSTEKDLITQGDIREFIHHLFENATDIKEDDKSRILIHMENSYRQYLEEYEKCQAPDKDWVKPILQWIKNYEPYSCI